MSDIASVKLTTKQNVQQNPFSHDQTVGGARKDRTLTTNVRLDREYVANGNQGYQPFLRVLGNNADDLTRQFGIQIYEQMMHDPEVRSSVNLIKRAILSEQWTIEPSLPAEHPQYNYAVSMADFVRYALDNMQSDPLVCFNEMLDGIWLGSAISEMTYRLENEGQYEGYLTLKDIKQKPTKQAVYIVDAYNNTVGIMTARYPGQIYPSGSLVAVPLTDGIIPGMLPRKKFIVFSWDSRDGDPRGQSILRPAYAAYWFKQQIFSEYLSWAAKFASPSLVGKTAQGAVPQTVIDANGSPVLDAAGLPTLQTPEQVLSIALQDFRNGSAIAVPYGAEVVAIETGNDGNAFAEALRVANSEIVKGITMQMLATMEGKNQSRAASETHKDVLGLVMLYAKQLFSNTIRRDCFETLIRYNFGPNLKMFVPKLSLSHGDGFPPSAEQIALLSSAGYLDPSQYDAIDSMLGLPHRKPGTVAPAPAPTKPGGASGTGAVETGNANTNTNLKAALQNMQMQIRGLSD